MKKIIEPQDEAGNVVKVRKVFRKIIVGYNHTTATLGSIEIERGCARIAGDMRGAVKKLSF